MGKYLIMLSKQAKIDLKTIKQSGRVSDIRKIETFLHEMENDPRKGTGSPEQLRYFDGEIWSRRINKKDRLVYEIFDNEVLITIIQAIGHYEDK
ncbi:MAG: Txe/YoeB family addiction module toxin [Chitinophagales bacterium]|nr:Txe/YoeB family addiction module toxin [Chitinophagales bacterium]